MLTDEQMRYPIGKFEAPSTITPERLQQWIDSVRALPANVRAAVTGLTDAQLDTPYRKDGWTIRQVAHHLPDSHMNSLLRFKWAMTEDNPIIKPYDEVGFALLADYKLPVESSLQMLESIHVHLVCLFESFTADDIERTFTHPATGKTLTLKQAIGMYAWHGDHHLAHIIETVKKF
ncbi:YfiT family bacillithiol transferase [Mucilaginibacter myungsuensis]|uniref:Metal-dependent hydrolase n=1 Tax=Mucilaginibacter myungsuensis TaxID=649104 RepID=A0A929L0V2_9SPHI|nr:putative metal-dependent hydrolase [Mucilaginibacter myungsuensis]MBE9664063.1 putative metal-dependent hydrolase [Mucilaginibacter myungsuensis]MDN3601241.1 putative metal-dependent hydrolase [Mucilaginibacter myungsuensis]